MKELDRERQRRGWISAASMIGCALLAIAPTLTHATHVAAGEILYQCLGNDEFLITLNLYRDCAGSELLDDQTITIDNPCGGPTTLTLDRVLVEEVSQLCADVVSTCAGGSEPGIERHVYEATVTLPRCDHITFSWTLCCRNGAIDNIFVDVNSTDFYIETTMYSQSFPCDDSPIFASSPVPYLCLGTPSTYGFGSSDANSDLTLYEFVEALEDPFTPCVYNAGFSFGEPLADIVMNPSTGQMSFTPTQLGNYVVTVLISTFTPDSVLIGTVMRDMQFVVIACGNIPPDPATGAVTNITGGNVVGTYEIDACATSDFCFDFQIIDPNDDQSVTLQTNLQTVFPGATISYSGEDTITGTICINVSSGSGGTQSFQITATDDACPVTGVASYVYSITICPPSTVVIPNVFSPNGDGVNDAFSYIEFSGFKEHQLNIYNRWGQLIHTSSTERPDNRIWRPGTQVSEGTYYYIFTGTNYRDEFYERTGHLTLLR